MSTSTGETEVQVFVDNFSERSGITEKLLTPRNEVDNAGFKRRVYSYKGIGFSFRGKEELPIIETVKNCKTILLGSDPVHVNSDSYQEYRSGIVKTGESIPDNLPIHYLVTKDIQGVISLALELGATDPNLIRVLEEVKSGIYSGRALDLIDKLVAVNCITDDEKEWNQKLTGGDAEAIVVLSLLGNSEASDYLDTKLEEMKILDSTLSERVSGNRDIETMGKSLESSDKVIGKLVAVHTTNFKPTKLDNGIYEVKTTGDATDWKIVRNSVHVTYNHKVSSHYSGNWDNTSFTILSPMEEMFRINGLPRCLEEADTWWVRNPGETLKFPNGHLVEPGNTKNGELYEIEKGRTIIKKEGYTTKELSEIKELRWPYLNTVSAFETIFFDKRDLHDFILSNWDLEKMSQLFVEKYGNEEDYAFMKEEDWSHILKYVLSTGKTRGQLENILEDSENLMVIDNVKKVLTSIDLISVYKGREELYDSTLGKLAEFITDDIEKELFTQLSEIAVIKTIESMGFRPFGSAQNSRHPHTPERWLTKGLNVRVEKASEIKQNKDGTQELINFNWKKFNPRFSVLPTLDPKTRRALYASGTFNSREG